MLNNSGNASFPTHNLENNCNEDNNEFVEVISNTIESFTCGREIEELSVEEQIKVGKCYLLLGNYIKAENILEHVSHLNPEVSDISFLFALACTYQNQGSLSKALHTFEMISNIDETSPYYKDYHLRRGLLYNSLKMFDRALSDLELIEEHLPSGLVRDDILFIKAGILCELGRLQDCLTVINDLCISHPHNITLARQLAFLLSSPEIIVPNIDLFVFDEELNNDPFIKYANHRNSISSRSNFDLLTGGLATEKNCFVIWSDISRMYFENDQYKDAKVALKASIVVSKEIFEIWYNLGIVFEAENDFNSAERCYMTGKRFTHHEEEFDERISMLHANNNENRDLILKPIEKANYFLYFIEKYQNKIVTSCPYLPNVVQVDNSELLEYKSICSSLN